MTVAHDCGLIINPRTMRTVLEGGVVMGISRALFEEVKFDHNSVQSVDWMSYPILDITDAPEAVDIVLIDRPDVASGGAGEPTHVAVPAAIANAVANATGHRVRQYPMTPENVKKAMTRV
jgi:CO/xanthine dehydrogenase Mo-binding subunit